MGTAIGGLWAAMGTLALPTSFRPLTISAALALTLILLGRLWVCVVPASRGFHRRKAFRIAVILETLALIAAGYLLTRYHLEAYMVPVIGIIVGLHFIGLWLASGSTAFLWMAAAMCTISAAAMALPAAPPGSLNERALFASYGNALVLWIGCFTHLQKKKRAGVNRPQGVG